MRRFVQDISQAAVGQLELIGKRQLIQSMGQSDNCAQQVQAAIQSTLSKVGPHEFVAEKS